MFTLFQNCSSLVCISLLTIINIIISICLIVIVEGAGPTCLAGTDCAVSYNVYSCSSWDPSQCSSRTDPTYGTVGNIAIIRSSSMLSALNAIAGGVTYALGGYDRDNNDKWYWYGTDEYFSSDDTPIGFAYVNWQSGQPSLNGNDMRTFSYPCASQKWNDYYASGDFQQCQGCSLIACTFDHAKYYSVLVTATFALPAMNFPDTYAVVTFRIVPEHVTWDVANARCQSYTQTDPWTGSSVRGVLAPILNSLETTLVNDIIATKSDVRLHSPDGTFAAWIGAKASSAGNGAWILDGTAAAAQQVPVISGGSCIGYPICPGGSNSPSTAGYGGAYTIIGKVLDWKITSTLLPFVCRFQFTPTLYKTIPQTYDRTFTTTTTTQKNFIVKYFNEWKSYSQADMACNSATVSYGGSTFGGTLALAFWDWEMDAISRLLKSVGTPNVGNSAGQQKAFGGAWIGAQTSTTGTFASNLLIAQNLFWNQNYNKIPYDTAQNFTADVYTAGSTSVCAPGSQQSCQTLDSTYSVVAGQRAGIAWDGANNWIAISSSVFRPYVCTWRFPVRFKLAAWLGLEQHPLPMSYADAKAYCATRDGTINGFAVKGQLRNVSNSMYSVIAAISTSSWYATGAFWIGTSNTTHCMTFDPATSNYGYQTDCTQQRAFACQFRPVSHTATPSNQKTQSPSATADITLTDSASASETSAETASTSFTADESKSISVTSAHSQSFSVSPTNMETKSNTVSPSGSSSQSMSVSEPISQTASGTLSHSLSDSTSKSASTSQSNSTSNSLSSSSSISAAKSSSTSPSLAHSSSMSVSESVETKTWTKTRTIPPTQTKTPSKTKSASATISDLTPSSSLLDTKTDSALSPTFSDAASPSHSFIIKPVPAVPVLEILSTTASTIAVFAGVPAAAVNQARLNSIHKLFKCGESAEFGDEPDFMSSPLKLSIANEPFNYARGIMVGNSVMIIAIAAFILVIVAVYWLVNKGTTWLSANLRLRNPGIIFVAFAILTPPSAQAATQLAFYGEGDKDMLIAIGFSVILVFLPFVLVCEICRVNWNGRIVRHDNINRKDDLSDDENEILTSSSEDEDDDSDAEEETKQRGQEVRRKRKLAKIEELRQSRKCTKTCQRSSFIKGLSWLVEPRYEWSDAVQSLSSDEIRLQKLEKEKIEQEEKSKSKKDEDFFDTLMSSPNGDDDVDEINNNNTDNIDPDLEELMRQNEEQKKDIVVNLNDLEEELLSSTTSHINLQPSFSSSPLTIKTENNNNDDVLTKSNAKIKPATKEKEKEKEKDYRGRPRLKGVLTFLEKNPWFAAYGSSGFEDYKIHIFLPLDMLTSIVLGITGGIASGITTVPVCIVCFSCSILVAGVHLFCVVRYLCVTPNFVLGYTIAGDILIFLSILLAFIQFLMNLLNEDEVYNALSLTNAALGAVSAIIGMISTINFLWQIFDAWYGLNREKKIKQRRTRKNKSREKKNDDHQQQQHFAFEIPEELVIDIEADLNALGENDNNNNDDDDQEMIDLTEFANADDDGEEDIIIHDVTEPEIEIAPDLNHLLDDGDENDQELDNLMYLLDDGDDEASELNKGVGHAGKNEELQRRMKELKAMLDKE